LKISIITVTYNSAPVLLDCLQSVSSQSHSGVEHIVIDGLSVDGTLALLQESAGRLAVWISERDNGNYDAMNKGVRLAQGDVIGFLNSDDIYANSEVLARVASAFNKDPLLEACYADLVYTARDNTSRLVRYWRSGEFSSGSFIRGWCPPHPTFFVRRSVYECFGGFNLSYKLAADFELMMRFLEVHKIRVQYFPEVWVKMRLGGATNKSVRNIFTGNREIFHAFRDHGLKASPVSFFIQKLFSRVKQFFNHPEL
jgi:glycosyltransferase involved in cell wall biosynthesis